MPNEKNGPSSPQREKLVATWECVVTESDGDSVWCDAYLLGQGGEVREFWEVEVPGNKWTEGHAFYVLQPSHQHRTELMTDDTKNARAAEKAFRQLREDWFNIQLRLRPHERIWETEADEEIREQNNAKMKAKFDEDTEAILRGEDRPMNPRCAAALYDQR